MSFSTNFLKASSFKHLIYLILSSTILFNLISNEFYLNSCLSNLRLYSCSIVVSEFLFKIPSQFSSQGIPLINNSKAKQKNKALGAKIGEIIQVIIFGFISLLFTQLITILFGAYIFQNFEETLTFSIVVSSLAFIRPLILFGPTVLHFVTERWTWGEEIEVRTSLALAGGWLGALPIPLDWDTPWQVWPLTCCIGAIVGEFMASGYLLYLDIFTKQGRKNKAT